MPSCAVFGCNSNSRKDKNYKFHGLPASDEIRQRWLSLLGRPLESLPLTATVCSKHFEPRWYTSRGTSQVLSRYAVPTLFLPLHVSERLVKLEPTDGLACRACLATDTKLYGIRETGMEDAFVNITGFALSPDGLPCHLCALCHTDLSKCASFRDKCERAQGLLDALRENGQISKSDIASVDRQFHKLTPNLTLSEVYKFDSKDNEVPTMMLIPKQNDGKVAVVGIDSVPTNCPSVDGEDDIQIKEETPPADTIEVKLEEDTDNICDEIEIHDDFAETVTKRDEVISVTSCDEIADFNDDVEIADFNDDVEIADFNDDDEINSDSDSESDEELKETIRRLKRKLETNTTAAKILEIKTKGAKITKNKTTAAKRIKTKITKANISTKKPKVSTENAVNYKGRRKVIGDEEYPDFDYAAFEKEFNVKIKLFTKEEQRKQMEAFKNRENNFKMPYRCEMCGKGYNYENTYKNHMYYHNPSIGDEECEICHYRFKYRRRLRSHSDRHRMSFTCVECGFVTRNRDHVRRHNDIHRGIVHKCKYCDKAYISTSSCADHMRLAHPTHAVACDECGETFLSQRGVHSHKALVHKKNPQPPSNLTCATCDIQFTNPSALERHASSATDETHSSLHPCVSCGENFPTEGELVGHGKECQLSQLYCDECDVTFSNVLSYDLHHRRKHLNERRITGRRPSKPYTRIDCICEYCGKRLRNKMIMTYHLRKHRGEKPYSCSLCPKAFVVKMGLDVHLGKRQEYQCDICGKALTTPSTLRVHIDQVHNKAPYKKRNRKVKKELKIEDEEGGNMSE